MHSHHSHSGDYVAHASDTLEGIVQKAIDMKFDVFCLTEHMPRLHEEFLYPEEIEKDFTTASLKKTFDDYYHHAKKVQSTRLASNCHTKFLVGLEVEGLNTEHIQYTNEIKAKYDIDMVVGSVHYVKEIPIDFDRQSWESSRDVCGGIHGLFREYFELQYEVITSLKPEVVGHFDLIRLFARGDDKDETTGKLYKDIDLQTDWTDVWKLVIRNLEFIKSYGGLVELNSAAIRKKWTTPYPQLDVAKAVVKYCDGRFCLSDDSHAISQVGLNYHKVLKYITDDLNLDKLYYLDRSSDGIVSVKTMGIAEVRSSGFWKQYEI